MCLGSLTYEFREWSRYNRFGSVKGSFTPSNVGFDPKYPDKIEYPELGSAWKASSIKLMIKFLCFKFLSFDHQEICENIIFIFPIISIHVGLESM